MTDPGRVDGLLQDGRQAEAVAFVRDSVRRQVDPIAWVQLAVQRRNDGDGAGAKAILSAINDERPGFSPAAYELAFIHRLAGEHRRAASLLAVAAQHDPRPLRTQLFLAHMLYAVGASREADAVLAVAKPAGAAEGLELDTMFAFGRYLEANPRGRSLVLHDRLVARDKWWDNQRVADEIARAVAQRRPFALVRYGDGEGGVLRLDAKDEATYRPLYEQNRDELIAMWFGRAFPWRTNGFLDLASTLLEATSECDVIGIPYESWIKHEYQISSLRGIPSLMNAVHALLKRSGPPRALASQLAHVELFKSGRLGQIIAAARKISVISCLEVLPDALKSKFDLEEVKFYRIPGEQGSRHILSDAAIKGTHYPDRFEQLQAELSKPHDGRLFLIAGGLLGKLYAAKIRRFGGVAVDIGSVADSWAGHATRPGFTREDALV